MVRIWPSTVRASKVSVRVWFLCCLHSLLLVLNSKAIAHSFIPSRIPLATNIHMPIVKTPKNRTGLLPGVESHTSCTLIDTAFSGLSEEKEIISPLHSCGLVAKGSYVLSTLCENSITARRQMCFLLNRSKYSCCEKNERPLWKVFTLPFFLHDTRMCEVAGCTQSLGCWVLSGNVRDVWLLRAAGLAVEGSYK